MIVGGTGGIGLACARRFLEEGARVVLAGLGFDPPPPSLFEMGMNQRWINLAVDASQEHEVAVMYEQASKFLEGRIDVLVHVAGISGRRYGDGPLHECSEEGWNRVMAANARMMFLTNRGAVRQMRGQSVDSSGLCGSIVNIGSVLAESPSPEHFGTVAYAASKGAVRSLTLSSAAKYASEHVRFNLIEPGLIDTPMATRALNDPGIIEFLRTKQAMTGKPGLPEDVAEAAVYLTEPASRFVTGTILPVDGGWRLLDGQYAKRPDE